eukprot:Nitzschia sp. Nitz4//scaffold24_size164493//13889//14236//NITZ4_002306-RA/size164493-processed-gene-0.179-mRNA-1//1//CDS//3329544048//6227//frame0
MAAYNFESEMTSSKKFDNDSSMSSLEYVPETENATDSPTPVLKRKIRSIEEMGGGTPIKDRHFKRPRRNAVVLDHNEQVELYQSLRALLEVEDSPSELASDLQLDEINREPVQID